jgi:hypothetical protein
MQAIINEPFSIIPIRETIGAVMRLIAAEWKNLVKLLGLPCLAIGVICALLPQDVIVNQDMFGNLQNGILPWDVIHLQTPHLLFNMLSVLLQCWLAMAIFRYVVLNEGSVHGLPPYQPAIWHYLGRFVLFGLVLAVPYILIISVLFFVLPKLLTAIVALTGILAVIYVGARIFLALPATAVGDDFTFRAAWHKTREQAFRIMTIKFLSGLLILLPMLVIMLLVFVVGMASSFAAKLVSFTLVTLVQSTVTYVTDAVIYAHFYRQPVMAEAVHG